MRLYITGPCPPEVVRQGNARTDLHVIVQLSVFQITTHKQY